MKMLELAICFTFLSAIYSYVECEDGESACPDGYICCQTTDCYKCCPDNRYCCKGGNYCCSSPDGLTFLHTQVLATPSFKPLDKSNIYGALIVFDKFLDSVSFYRYDRGLGIVRSLLLYGVDSFWRSIGIINDQQLYQNKTDYFINVTYSLSEVLYYIKQDLGAWEYVNSDLPRTINAILDYLQQPGYEEKLISNIITNLSPIKQELKDSIFAYERQDYTKTSELLSNVFKTIFIIN
jgi:hypothetical protein